MAVHLLTRHREPKPTESLYGYILCLTDDNGYERPSRVLARAGIPPQKVVGRDLDVGKLAKITGHSEKLARIAYKAEKYGNAFLLGHRVSRRDIRCGATAVCPQCIAERGFLQVHFDLKLMVACPVHRSYLIQKCAVCKQDLIWARPGLLHCSCGAPLPARSPAGDALSGELKLLTLIREKVLGDTEHIGPGLEDHERAFLSYDLQSLLYTIRQLGKHWSRVHGGSFESLGPAEIISNAAVAISDWPHNFNRLIHLAVEIRAKETPPRSGRKEFAVLYREMFAHQEARRRSLHERGPIWNAYIEFAVASWGRDAADPRLFRASLGSEGRFITAAEASRRTGIHRKTIIRMANEGKLEAFAPSVGSMRPLIAVTAISRLGARDVGRVLNIREAAQMLSVSIGALKVLKARGVYRSQRYTPGFKGFHEEDLEDLRRRLVAPSRSGCDSPTDSAVSFRRLMKYTAIGPKAKADLIEAILVGRIPLLGKDGTSPDRRQIALDSISDKETRRLASMLA